MAAAERSFPKNHPTAQGHFPGNPVIPGAVLLAEVLRAIETGLGANLASFRLKSAKFTAPSRPGDRVVIEYFHTTAGGVRFECMVGTRAVLKGELQCDPVPKGA